MEKKTKTTEKNGGIQVEALKSLESSDKESPIKHFISERMLNSEIIDELDIREQ